MQRVKARAFVQRVIGLCSVSCARVFEQRAVCLCSVSCAHVFVQGVVVYAACHMCTCVRAACRAFVQRVMCSYHVIV